MGIITIIKHKVQFRFVIKYITRNMGVFTQTVNHITGSSEWRFQDDNYDYHQEITRSAFADMLHDTERNKKYFKALKAAIDKMHAAGKQANVLDIGTGTGLLSIMAAHCGADTITACEAFEPMAKCAAQIMEHNKVAHKIKIISKRSTDIAVGPEGDMESRANILVTEVFDTELIGEGAIETFTHAHKHLMEADCIVVPDSGTIYAQVVECPTMQKWNKLNDLADEDGEIVLKMPEKMKSCAGSAAVHDIQLSQLDKHLFRELSEPIPVLHYDWSGKLPIDKDKSVVHKIKCLRTGMAQMVFMWWDLKMDTEGDILLSCAPWWQHPDTKTQCLQPQETIPWRDHWMQAVYYFPKEISVNENEEVSLCTFQDEYSLWFYLESQTKIYADHMRPVCDCGIHLVLSRTHVSYMNDSRRNKKYLSFISDNVDKTTTAVCLNGSSLLGLAASKFGAKIVYYVETNTININIIKEYMQTNSITNIQFVPSLESCPLGEVDIIIAEPLYSNTILPWDSLRSAYIMKQYETKLKDTVTIVPKVGSLWCMPVQFLDLHKIRIPLGVCESIDLSLFDKLIEDSRSISDEQLEPQPLWEYPCVCKGDPFEIFKIDLNNIEHKITIDEKIVYDKGNNTCNGFALWMTWNLDGSSKSYGISSGPLMEPNTNEKVIWDMHTRQAIKLFSEEKVLKNGDKISYKIDCDLDKGKFDIDVSLLEK